MTGAYHWGGGPVEALCSETPCVSISTENTDKHSASLTLPLLPARGGGRQVAPEARPGGSCRRPLPGGPAASIQLTCGGGGTASRVQTYHPLAHHAFCKPSQPPILPQGGGPAYTNPSPKTLASGQTGLMLGHILQSVSNPAWPRGKSWGQEGVKGIDAQQAPHRREVPAGRRQQHRRTSGPR